ncbi:hypothetical protein GGD83_003313 [Rhodoblastus sphagnicola]|uniref:O-antigen ligase family protein n=1 Tax=Rhodoblastus sphagnicola TaxID=333368 RepID=UPI001609A897|nr:O-antigen ligase family protein [Rhodoblastus sphagnicola]MBB4199497.1 hypothetical protein [Rhodoblastus sphagnicola]
MTDNVFNARQPKAGRIVSFPRLDESLFWLTVASGSVVFIEPAPYDVLILITIFAWALRGFSIHRTVLPLVVLVSAWTLGGFIALIPYWNEPDPVGYMFSTLYLATTCLFFAIFLCERTTRRLELLFNAYVVSCVFAGAVAVLAWIANFGGGDLDSAERATAFFKDPNVLGSYMVIGFLVLTQRLLLGRAKRLWIELPSLGLVAAGLFLSFSRGSWGAAAFALAMMVGFLIVTADSKRMRFRVAASAAGVLLMVIVGVGAALSVDSLRTSFSERVSLGHDYDEGPDGRFGRQIRAIPMLLDRPNGFGPLRFRLTFGLEPHNSYVNSFASNGWLGGFSFIALALTTGFVGFRLCGRSHPYQRQAQVLFPATFVYFLQAMQIDIDHWRMFYLSVGSVWGLEAARLRWLATARPNARAEPLATHSAETSGNVDDRD